MGKSDSQSVSPSQSHLWTERIVRECFWELPEFFVHFAAGCCCWENAQKNPPDIIFGAVFQLLPFVPNSYITARYFWDNLGTENVKIASQKSSWSYFVAP